MVVAGSRVRVSSAVAGQTAGKNVGLGQRHVVTLEMLLQAGQLAERLRASVHHTPVRTVTCNQCYH